MLPNQNDGLIAPPPGQGLSAARPAPRRRAVGRSAVRRRGLRARQISAAVASARSSRGGQPAIGDRAQANLGAQLTARVDSGAITQKQAQRTASERRLLAESLGPDWRQELYGGVGRVAQLQREAGVRPGGASTLEYSPEKVRAQAVLKQLMERRKRALGRARNRLTPPEGTSVA